MLEKYLNRKVGVCIFNATQIPGFEKGIVTAVDENFIELDNDLTIAIKYIISIKAK
ncbi:MAG: hypothetical protein J6J36_01850 [Clostridia bacterium]|nr:hypothetical protein [Clostridia bacterium]